MNILIYGVNAWDDTNSFGNTISNWFCGDEWKNDKFSNFYNRSQLPDNKAVVNYYRLTSIDILKGFLKGKIKGKSFSSDELEKLKSEVQKDEKAEQSMINYVHKNSARLIYWADDVLWRSRIWINNNFENFILKEKPDIFFAFARKPASLWPIVSYLKGHTACKVVLFVADDVKSYYKNISWKKRLLRSCIEAADKLYAVSDEMSATYSDYYGKEVLTLYKGCNLSLPIKSKLNKPMRVVYAGNLSYGRDATLSIIAETLKKINSSRTVATLEIYSTATPIEELEEKFNIQGSSQFMGSRSYDEIIKIMHEADIVLHVESFEKKSIDKARYSLSTKIADCLQSGAFVLGIGPRQIASIEYLRRVDGAFVIDNASEIESKLKNILLDESNILSSKIKTREYAQKYQEISLTQKSLRNDLEALLR